MGDHLLHPLTSGPARRAGSEGRGLPWLVLAGGMICFAVLSVTTRTHAQASSRRGVTGPALIPAGGPLLPRASSEDVAAGRRLYVVQCSSCHGLDVRGTPDGPELVDSGAAAADFYLRTGRMPLNDPRQQPVRHAPAYSDAQISQLVAYLGSLGSGPPIPTVLPGDLASGNQLFSLNCAQCHNDAGAGGALGYGDIVPPLHHATPLDVAEATRVGPRPMPVFGPNSLSDQQVSDIAAYVQYLRHPEDRGGLGLGHLGPIPEGFVAWVVGMGALLLVARLIGTRG